MLNYMTVNGWLIFIGVAFFLSIFGITGVLMCKKVHWRAMIAIATVVAVFVTYFGMLWYFKNTASGRRAITDQKSDFYNGMERIITVYTADGSVIARYEGKIDIEENAGGYLLFDYDGKRYTYYNCFIESIANIE